jgi:hypothetical protein
VGNWAPSHAVPDVTVATSSIQFSCMTIPEGWTDDMNIPLVGATADDVVEFILARAPLADYTDVDYEGLLLAVAERFAISQDDAALALDRTQGGVVRARTRAPENCPNRDKDPMAYASYQKLRDQLRPKWS